MIYTKGFVCFCSNEMIMVIPGEVTRHDDSKIFMGIRKGDRKVVIVVWSICIEFALGKKRISKLFCFNLDTLVNCFIFV